MNGISPWAAAASYSFSDDDLPIIFDKKYGIYDIKIHLTSDSLWLLAIWPKGGKIAFRMVYSPEGELTIKKKNERENTLQIELSSIIGDFSTHIIFPVDDQAAFRFITQLKPKTDLLIPFWPRDIIIPGNNGKADNTAGKIHISQKGTRSGLLYFSMTRPKAGSVLYLQNLTALADYCEQTQTSCANVVGGSWPELGLCLPPSQDKPLSQGKLVTISDAIVVFDPEVPDQEAIMVQQYINMLATAYMLLPRPDTECHNWPEILDKGLDDLINKHGCWSQVAGHQYFNAYVCDYNTPPEIMVQLAVLLPLLDYVEWSGKKLEVMKIIKEGLPAFYDDKLKTIRRWLPAAVDKLTGDEEQKKPDVMDSWYLHHPLLNLSRLALKGDEVAKQLFLNSLDYCIKVAHHFSYIWPVFYNMETLETVKAETAPGKGGEKDVAGLYTHVMVQAYELTGDKRYLKEAEKAAKTLQDLGFDLLYQANNTAFSAGALLRLFKITKNKLYLELSNLCIANILKNVQLWDCNYGYGKNFPSFFALFPLSDAPYTAVYEEQEVFCALHDYLKHAEGVEILPSLKLLISEYIRYLVYRAVYYYPAMLPKEMLKDKPKTGEIDQNLWIALEDLHDGWEQSGEVGQEVYGAGNAFGILPRHYHRVPGEEFMVFVDYPITRFSANKAKRISFNIQGDSRMECNLVLVPVNNKSKLPTFKVTNKEKKEIKGKPDKLGNLAYQVSGNESIYINW